jgi:hypothetical protein
MSMTDHSRPPPDATKSPEGCAAEDEKWRTVRSALDSWDRTARMCVIYLTLNVPVEILAWLIKH